MSAYAQLPSGVILPQALAASVMHQQLFGPGGYRTANPNNRHTAGWITTGGSADSDTLGDVQTLRQQSRDLVRNEALPAGIIASNVTAVVGTGVVPQSRVNADALGISQEQAERWQRQAEAIFNQAAEKNHFDAERRQNFWQMQATVQRGKKESGDIFAIRRYLKRAGKKLGLAVQLVESDRCSTPTNATFTERDIRAGCERDSDGAPVAWHFSQVHPGERFMARPVAEANKWTRIEAFDKNGDPLVLPIIEVLRPGQTRGVPYLAPVIELLKQLTRYTEAEVAAAVVSGMLAVMVTSQSPVGPLGASTAAGVPGMVGTTQQSNGAQKVTRLQSGMIVDLAPGEDIKVVSGSRPNTAFDPFVTAVLRQVGSALEIPFEVLTKHFQSSYSAARAALLDFWRFVLRERDFLVASFCQPVWEWAITEAVAEGWLAAPGFFDDPMIRAAWLGCDWIGPGMPAIDPLKEAAAAEAWNALGIWSRQDISAQQSRDFDRTHQQLVREKNMRERDGLAALPAPDGADPAAPGQPNNQPPGNGRAASEQLRTAMVDELLKDDA
jgi:lambda family phage portal protein